MMNNSTAFGFIRPGAAVSSLGALASEEAAHPVPGHEGPLPKTGTDCPVDPMHYAFAAEWLQPAQVRSTPVGTDETMLPRLLGRDPEAFLDKLGEQLAFERIGARLYEAMLIKAGAAEYSNAALSLHALRTIHDDELRHFGLLAQALHELGAEPVAPKLHADAPALNGQELAALIAHPQTSLTQACTALLTAELTDNAGWELLIELAEEHGQQKMAAQFRNALAEEREHLTQVRRWLEGLLLHSRATPAEVFIP